MSQTELYFSGVGWFVIPVYDPFIIFPRHLFDTKLAFPDFYIEIMIPVCMFSQSYHDWFRAMSQVTGKTNTNEFTSNFSMTSGQPQGTLLIQVKTHFSSGS